MVSGDRVGWSREYDRQHLLFTTGEPCAKYSRNHTEGLSKKALFKWQALYRWKAQFNPRRAGALEEQSRRPGRTRVPQYSTQLQRRVIELRKQYGWGKDKLVVLVAAFGYGIHRLQHHGAQQHLRRNRRPARSPVPPIEILAQVAQHFIDRSGWFGRIRSSMFT